MKNKTLPLISLFYSGRLIITLLLLCIVSAIAQQPSTSEEFTIGASFSRYTRHLPGYYKSFRESGMNFLHQYADGNSKTLLNGLNFAAYNSEWLNEWIYYYSTAYYSKWEAEENQLNKYKVGVKHNTGTVTSFLGRQCWSTEGSSAPVCSLVYGPHYYQEKVYKRWYEGDYPRLNLKYTPRFIMALDTLESINPNDTICRLYVVARYRIQENGIFVGDDRDMVLKSIVLKASDFQPYGTFKTMYIDDGIKWYQYPKEFKDPEDGQPLQVYFFDRWGDEGIQFCVDWLREDKKCNLYIDYIEVYDIDGGQDFADYPDSVTSKVTSYAQGFPQSVWTNMKFWGGCDEPSSIDNYIPLKTVDSILESIGAPRLITTFYPWWEITVNGDTQLVKYYNAVHPKKLIIDFFPVLADYSTARFDDWDRTRMLLQICHSLQPDFYFQAQATGIKVSGIWKGLRKPDSHEFIAQTMLALAHGVKGIIFWGYDSWRKGNLFFDGIVDLKIEPTDLWYIIHDNLVPRLKGKLGKTLMTLNYTGNYLQHYKIDKKQDDGSLRQLSDDFLTLGFGSSQPEEKNWHCGLFRRQNHPDDKYFLLANLYTIADSRSIEIKLTETGRDYKNYRFRNIEGKFDTTFAVEFTKQINHTKGEGYLYQVAPVIKYGGRLLFSEETKNGIELTDDIIIENGAVLTISGDYYAKANIIVKNGRVAYKNRGKIHFASNKKLITK